MKTDMKPRGALRLTPCNYGLSKVQFRGPLRPTDGRFVVFLGGSETFAKYIPQPFPGLIETAIGEVCVNLGCQSAGPDVFLHDTAIQSLCHDAASTVIQIVGAANLSNPFYKVHPRRNDRFIAPSEKLAALYPEIDFAEIAFTGHLISRLRAVDEERFKQVKQQLENTWLRRMKTLIGQSGGPVFLLTFKAAQDTKSAPAFVSPAMIDSLRPYVSDVIEIAAEQGNTKGMSFAPLDALAAQDTLAVDVHVATAKALRAPLLRALS